MASTDRYILLETKEKEILEKLFWLLIFGSDFKNISLCRQVSVDFPEREKKTYCPNIIANNV